ncbi:MAG: PIN domain-containing protein [Leptospiraceae bacterium]|nr:PIN domain-containing protein [Leptospiraceae bacterium]
MVDTSVWSLSLRRTNEKLSASEEMIRSELIDLIQNNQAVILGVIKQELLSGIRFRNQFQKLKEKLSFFPDLEILSEDFEKAAEFYNSCKAKGVTGTSIDFLICSVSHRLQYPVFTLDRDFENYRKILPIELYLSENDFQKKKKK